MSATTRRWRLRGYAGKDLKYDQKHPSDAALGQAVARLEKDPDITRITATPL